jgi:hypothetical protein
VSDIKSTWTWATRFCDDVITLSVTRFFVDSNSHGRFRSLQGIVPGSRAASQFHFLRQSNGTKLHSPRTNRCDSDQTVGRHIVLRISPFNFQPANGTMIHMQSTVTRRRQPRVFFGWAWGGCETSCCSFAAR